MTRAAQLNELRSILNGIICERKWALHKLTAGNLPITHEITRHNKNKTISYFTALQIV